MDYFTTTSKPSRRAVDCVIVGVYSRGKLGAAADEINTASNGAIKRLIKSGDVSGSPGRWAVLSNLDGVRAQRVVVVGLGKSSEFGILQFRRATMGAIRSVARTKCSEVLNGLTLEAGVDPYYSARATAESAAEVLYRFTAMKSGRKKPLMPLKRIGVLLEKRSQAKRAELGMAHGEGIGKGVALARELGNLPANVCTPSYLARTAQNMAKGDGKLSTRVLNETDMKRLGMGSLLSVTAGAAEPAKLIVMQYKGGGKDKPVVLVGKGVTFDTGGISLKPGLAMDEMKFDMCGAASVIGTMAAVAALKLPINLNVVVPAVVNMPGSKATVPGDIVKSMSGKTIEVLNTDAEGRLILCDALTYSRRFKPSAIIDVATLTGACVVALGKHHAGLLGNDDDLANDILAAGLRANDRAWRLPIGADYAAQLKSNFADFANIGGREAGTITAACFLGKFTEDMAWAHLDIAGVAWHSGAKKGATGRPVPMLSEFLLSRCGVLPQGSAG